MRTIGAWPLLVCAGTVALLLMTSCLALGYRIAQSTGSSRGLQPAVAGLLDFRRPEGRVLVDRVGNLSGRLTRLEIEAADLAKRLGISPTDAIQTNTQATSQGSPPRTVTPEPAPSGGPLLPVDDSAVITAAASAPVGDYGTGLSQLETDVARLEASLETMTDAAAEHDLTNMAYPNRLPVLGKMPRISSGFGVRRDPFTGRLAHHMGLDIPAARGTAVLASGGGRVLSAGYRGPYGNAVVIDHGNGLQTLYGHCSKLFVRAGDLVMPRQKIAAVGSTGRSTGPHLHFEVIRNGARVEPGRILASVLARNAD